MYELEKEKIDLLDKRIVEATESMNLSFKRKELAELKTQQENPEFFQDFVKMTALSKEIKTKEKILTPWNKIEAELKDLKELLLLSKEEEQEDMSSELQEMCVNLEKLFQIAETQRLLGEEGDENNAIVTVQAGAGGTESCDWASMLERMYVRYSEKRKFKVSILEEQSGDEAGIRHATLLIAGENATGLLRSENGVHRLVRISPFDSARRRHTSFASVSVIPEIADDIEINIAASDLRVDTFRASGAGGQHVNTTDSAVRVTHLPTGIVASCQAERSQLQNKDKAMKMLKAKLFDYERNRREEKQRVAEKDKKKIEWGSQIRSYVFHPYTMVKDHRTLVETGDVSAVMDGNLESFSAAYLRYRQENLG